jgi:hypothetical protein
VAGNGVTRYTLQYKVRRFDTRGGTLPAVEALSIFFLVQFNILVNGFYDQDKNYANRCKTYTLVEATLKAG